MRRNPLFHPGWNAICERPLEHNRVVLKTRLAPTAAALFRYLR